MPNEYVSPAPDTLGFEVRKLTAADRTAVLELVTPGVSEIPIYKWQVGAPLDAEIDPALAELCADNVLAPHWPDGVYGAVADDFTSATGESTWTMRFHRGDWDTEIVTSTELTCDEREFHLSATLDAFEGRRRVFSRTWNESVPRDHL